MENNTNTEVATKKPTASTVRELLVTHKEKLQMALPKHLSADRMIMMATTSITRNPKLLECSQISLLGAVMQAAQIGLEPDGVMGQAYLIPFKGQVQFIPGYKGLVALAYRSPNVRSFQARAVYEGDEFVYELGLEEKLRHVPCGKKDKGLTHVYAILTFNDGGKMFEVMTRDEVQLIKNKSQGKFNSVWTDNEEEMSKKTVIRRIAKVAPLSSEFQRAAALDEMHFELGQNQKNHFDTLTDEPAYAEVINDEVSADAKAIAQQEQKAGEDARKAKADQATAGVMSKIGKAADLQ